MLEIDADGLTRRQRHQSLQVVGVVATVSVQNEVLKQEDDVEEDGDESDAELGEVAEETDPVGIVVGEQQHLEDAEGAAAQVEQHAADRPADRRLPLVIEPGLRRVLDDRDGERNVREIRDGSQPGEDAESSDRHQDDCCRHERQ